MKIYVATKWEEKDRAREVMDQLRQAGHSITYDWTMSEFCDVAQAEADKQGVMDADALVVIFEKDLRYAGAWAEFGMAAARGIPIYVLGTACDDGIFLLLKEVRRGIDELLRPRLLKAA